MRESYEPVFSKRCVMADTTVSGRAKNSTKPAATASKIETMILALFRETASTTTTIITTPIKANATDRLNIIMMETRNSEETTISTALASGFPPNWLVPAR